MGAEFGKIAEGMGEGGASEGADPEQWSGAGERPGQGYAPNPSAPSGTGPGGGTVPEPPKPPAPPKIPPPPKMPSFYANRLAPQQRDIRNVTSTSHQYLARFGASGSHF